jgi:type I restriction enzyme R subunit
MLDKNPLRLEFYDKYQKIIEEYNNGKDAEAIRKAFEDLVKFINEMNEEEHRSAKEGLDEETLAIYDLLRKNSLTKNEEAKVKEVAIEMLTKLKTEKLRVERWRESTQVTAQVKTMIRDNLFHLPEKSYLDDEVETKTVDVYQHIYSNYYGGGASTYNTYAA